MTAERETMIRKIGDMPEHSEGMFRGHHVERFITGFHVDHEGPMRLEEAVDRVLEPALPLTPDDAQVAYDNAPEVPLSDERIQEIVAYATASPGPQTHEEARQFHEGFLSGATAYAAAVGHSTLKSNNPKLCEVFDAQGWKTIETFEKLAVVPVVCEHGVKDGDWCEPCNKDMKAGIPEDAYFRDDLDGGRLVKKLACANCSEVSSNPGQFLKDGRWVCTESCRKELANEQSYDDLRASGGIVDAP